MRIVTGKENMPVGKHYVILDFSSYHVPGDERSKTNPGHGYPDRNIPYAQYSVTEDHDEWKKEITRRTIEKDVFVAFEAGPLAIIELKATITVK